MTDCTVDSDAALGTETPNNDRSKSIGKVFDGEKSGSNRLHNYYNRSMCYCTSKKVAVVRSIDSIQLEINSAVLLFVHYYVFDSTRTFHSNEMLWRSIENVTSSSGFFVGRVCVCLSIAIH